MAGTDVLTAREEKKTDREKKRSLSLSLSLSLVEKLV